MKGAKDFHTAVRSLAHFPHLLSAWHIHTSRFKQAFKKDFIQIFSMFAQKIRESLC